jgi:putative SOS response-associated peptidase YedK
MCGRYRLSRRKQIIEEYFDASDWQDDWSPRFNIAPMQPVPVIRQHPNEPVRQISTMRWGLIPNWARDASIASGTINVESETVANKPTFRDLLRLRRRLIRADGFYEWKRTARSKQPFCFEVNNGELFAFAGIWDGWKNPDGQWIKTCSILTTAPNAVTAAVHDRIPVILDPGSYDRWLDPEMQNIAAISELLKPHDGRLMRCYPVSSRLNHVTNDDADCSRPMEFVETQDRLFL